MKCLILLFIVGALSDDFIVSLYRETVKNKESENLIISPFSLEAVLSLVRFGSKGSTRDEISTVLSNDSKIEVLNQKQYDLHPANKIYVKKGFEISTEFKNAAQKFGAFSENINFEETVRAAATINQWVGNQTRDKISHLVKDSDFNDRTRLVLINAVYFKGDWVLPFVADSTSKQNFHVSGTKTVQVNTMFSQYQKHFLYYECHNLKAKFLELLFESGTSSMVFILPNDRNGLSALEEKMDRVLTPHNLTLQLVDISLPKFKIESRIDFKQILQNLGVRKAFAVEEADLSGIAGSKGDLIIDQVVQKGYVDVSEDGVEAAAATFMTIPIPPSAPEPSKEFKADHPFLFYLKIEGVVVFVGRVLDPTL